MTFAPSQIQIEGFEHVGLHLLFDILEQNMNINKTEDSKNSLK